MSNQTTESESKESESEEMWDINDRTGMAEDEYFVEKVVNKTVIDGEVKYEVKWCGYPDSDNTMEDIFNMLNSLKSVADFEKKMTKEGFIGEKAQSKRKKQIYANMDNLPKNVKIKSVLSIAFYDEGYKFMVKRDDNIVIPMTCKEFWVSVICLKWYFFNYPLLFLFC